MIKLKYQLPNYESSTYGIFTAFLRHLFVSVKYPK